MTLDQNTKSETVGLKSCIKRTGNDGARLKFTFPHEPELNLLTARPQI